jgi:hypothetical protein
MLAPSLQQTITNYDFYQQRNEIATTDAIIYYNICLLHLDNCTATETEQQQRGYCLIQWDWHSKCRIHASVLSGSIHDFIEVMNMSLDHLIAISTCHDEKKRKIVINNFKIEECFPENLVLLVNSCKLCI